MSKTKHTPGPWRLLDTPVPPNCGHTLDGDLFYRQIIAGPDAATVLACDMGRNTAARIVACVNACEGIEDPAALPKALSLAKSALIHDSAECEAECPGCRALDAIAKAEGRSE